MPRPLYLALGIAALVMWWLVLRPVGLGGPASYVVIRGDSMQPVYDTGDLVMMRAADSYAVGDIVGYRVPDGELGAGLLVIHRIVGGDPASGFVIQGDNNPAPDPWLPTADSVEGAALLAIPGVGRLLSFLHQPAALAALAVSFLVAWFAGRGPSKRPEGGSLASPV